MEAGEQFKPCIRECGLPVETPLCKFCPDSYHRNIKVEKRMKELNLINTSDEQFPHP